MIFERLVIEEFNNTETKKCLKKKFTRLIKSEELAKGIRVTGNELFTNSRHDFIIHQNIWDAYLCSIALSPNKSETLATSYGNMSALMFHLQKYQECIKNIDSSLNITESIPLKIKLLCRKAKCLSALGSPEKNTVIETAKTWLDKIDDNDTDKNELVKLFKKAKNVLSKNKVKVKSIAITEISEENLSKSIIKKKKKGKKVRKENSDFEHLKILADIEKQNIFTNVCIDYSDQYSSHLVATKDIQAGEIIFVVKPHITVPHFLRGQNFCNNCLNVIWHGLPCENCACCMYCSEECQYEAAQKYHDIECLIVQFLVSGESFLDYYVQASLRAVIMSVKEFGSIENLMLQMENIDNCTDNYTGFDNFQHNSFISIFGFKNSYLEPSILSDLTSAACRTVICLSRFTPFFEKHEKLDTIEDFIENKKTIFIASLLLRVAAIMYNNGIKVTQYGLFCKSYEDTTVCNSHVPCCERGYSLNTLSQFIPHSCDPNVKSIKTINCKEIYYALQPIYKGSLLLECYQSTFYELNLSYRSESIAQIIGHSCYCRACQEDWPSVLINDDKMISMDELIHIVANSREHNNQKERFFKLLDMHGLAHQDIVDELSKIMLANFNYFGQPSIEVCATMHFINLVFKELYEVKLYMDVKCKIV